MKHSYAFLSVDAIRKCYDGLYVCTPCCSYDTADLERRMWRPSEKFDIVITAELSCDLVNTSITGAETCNSVLLKLYLVVV